NAIADEDILDNAMRQAADHPDLTGRTASQEDPLVQKVRVGRFGWKAQNPTLMLFTAEALNTEMGITTAVQPNLRSARGTSEFPRCIVQSPPPDPNDNGSIMTKLSYFQALLAPPARGPITAQSSRGEKIFEKLQC